MTKEELQKVEDKLDTTDIEPSFWQEYREDVYKIIDDNEKLKEKLKNASLLVRKNAFSVKSETTNEVNIYLKCEEWEELLKLLEDC